MSGAGVVVMLICRVVVVGFGGSVGLLVSGGGVGVVMEKLKDVVVVVVVVVPWKKSGISRSGRSHRKHMDHQQLHPPGAGTGNRDTLPAPIPTYLYVVVAMYSPQPSGTCP
jgi:hypothetical protein